MVVSDVERGSGGESPILPRSSSCFRLYAYMAPLIAVPFLVLAVAFLVVPSDWFLRHAGSGLLMSLGYGAGLRNTSCQVAIYGDSTAMIGVNPDVIQERTHLSTCNLGEIEGMTLINDTMVLDQFLEHNPRPRYIVFLYSPEGLAPQSQRSNPDVTEFEATNYRFRQPHKLASFIALMRHPEDVFSWAEHGMLVTIESPLSKPMDPGAKLPRYRATGQVALGLDTLTSCSYRSHAVAPDKKWIDSLRSRYAVQGTEVLVDAMLLPDCDPDLEYFRRHLSGLIDNRIDTLPASDFYIGGRHVNLAGAQPLSSMIADQIQNRLHAESTTGAH